jgi:mannose-6-phosphate isomerase-like protein (cupin superfamily)
MWSSTSTSSSLPPTAAAPSRTPSSEAPRRATRSLWAVAAPSSRPRGSDVDGSFSLTETTLEPGFPGPVAHRHRGLVDSFYVLAGALALRLGERELRAGPETFALVPPGKVYSFSNPAERAVRMLNVMAPGGFEQYLKELARAAPGGHPDPTVMAEIASRYDFESA